MNLFGLFFHDESQGVNDLHACSASVENLENIKNQHSLENAEMYIIKPVKMKRMNAVYTDTPSHERIRIHGVKKVREFSDGLKILFGMIKLFLKIK